MSNLQQVAKELGMVTIRVPGEARREVENFISLNLDRLRPVGFNGHDVVCSAAQQKEFDEVILFGVRKAEKSEPWYRRIFRKQPLSLEPLLCFAVSPRVYGAVKSLKYRLIKRTTEIRVGGPGQRLWVARRFWVERRS